MSTSRRRRFLAVAAGLGVVAAAVVAFGWFEVHTLVIDDRVAETVPVEGEASWQGTFASIDHDTSGRAAVIGVADDRYVRFEDFHTSNGPDLHVFLVPADGDGVYDAIDLGPLKGNIGDQNYLLPTTADLTRYSRVLVWCVRFDSPFGAATLSPN